MESGGVPESLVKRGGFTFSKRLTPDVALAAEESPWSILHGKFASKRKTECRRPS